MGKQTDITQAELETKATSVLLGKPVKFTVDGVGDFEIKKIPLGVWVMISEEALKIDPQKGGNALNVIASAKVNALPVCRIIATAVLWGAKPVFVPARTAPAKKVLGIRITKEKVVEPERVITRDEQVEELAEKLVDTLEAQDIYTLVMAITNKMNADFFFSSTSLLSGIRMMSPATPETIPSGEPSQG